MSKMIDKLRSARIFNERELVRCGDPWIVYQKPELRSSVPSGWRVYVKGRTFPGPWYEYGVRTFSPLDPDSLGAAREFAAQETGVTEWEKSPFNNRGRYPTWIPKGTTERAMALIAGAKE